MVWNDVCLGSYRFNEPSTSTGADIRIDRRRHPHRPAQTSASTGADIRIDRRRHPHRPTQMLKVL
ncbi:hypothetical protein [Leyella stercorea]|uniref:hypothetical protein n=1 Tax=Leyella stercorea TaxID=363265 RepID=UPI0024321FD5|nr:hypothetical protein [Leyella stercorea]